MSETELKQKIENLTQELSNSITELVFVLTSTGVQPGKPPRPRRELEIIGPLTFGVFQIKEGIKAWAYPQD